MKDEDDDVTASAAVLRYLKRVGAKGGKAGTGKAKVRGDSHYYSKVAAKGAKARAQKAKDDPLFYVRIAAKAAATRDADPGFYKRRAAKAAATRAANAKTKVPKVRAKRR